MIKTYTYKVKPNKRLESELENWLGVTRYVYNLGKEVREEAFKKSVRINYFDLAKQLTEAKKEFNWLKKVHSQTLQASLERLEEGYKKFFTDLKAGKNCSKPHWAKKYRWKSITFKSIKTTHNAFKLPTLGLIKVFKFKQPKGELRTAVLIKEADGWYLKIAVKEENKTDSKNQTICAITFWHNICYIVITNI